MDPRRVMEKVKEWTPGMVAGLVIGALAGILIGVFVVPGVLPGFAGIEGTCGSDDSLDLCDAFNIVEAEPVENACDDGVYIDVSGSVAMPGLYCVSGDAVLADAIELAGGFTGEVCAEWLARDFNQAGLVDPNSKLYVPGIDDPECGVGDAGAGGVDGESAVSGCEGVDLNNATQEELETLPGVGPVTAEKILEARPFKDIENLLDVSGIGPATFEKLEPLVCL